jgi:AAA domain
VAGTNDLRQLLTATTAAGAKTVLVGDQHQLAPVKARGGMFELLCADLPWSQRLGEVWRMNDPAERDNSLALRAARGNRLRSAVGWYRNNGRLHAGDPITMAADALDAYMKDRVAGKDALLIADT